MWQKIVLTLFFFEKQGIAIYMSHTKHSWTIQLLYMNMILSDVATAWQENMNELPYEWPWMIEFSDILKKRVCNNCINQLHFKICKIKCVKHLCPWSSQGRWIPPRCRFGSPFCSPRHQQNQNSRPSIWKTDGNKFARRDDGDYGEVNRRIAMGKRGGS